MTVITKTLVNDLMNIANVDKTTRAMVTYTVGVKTASPRNNEMVASNPNVQIYKQVVAIVTLFRNADDEVYAKAVKESAKSIFMNGSNSADNFEVSEPSFTHTDIYSIVKNKITGREYLYAHYESATSEYFIDGLLSTKQEVAEYLTPSESKKLLDTTGIVYNATNDVYHDVQVRTIALDNVRSISLI
jgi:hypothetical protein